MGRCIASEYLGKEDHSGQRGYPSQWEWYQQGSSQPGNSLRSDSPCLSAIPPLHPCPALLLALEHLGAVRAGLSGTLQLDTLRPPASLFPGYHCEQEGLWPSALLFAVISGFWSGREQVVCPPRFKPPSVQTTAKSWCSVVLLFLMERHLYVSVNVQLERL